VYARQSGSRCPVQELACQRRRRHGRCTSGGPLRRQAGSYGDRGVGWFMETPQAPCRSWLASEGAGTGDACLAGLFAGKPAPTGMVVWADSWKHHKPRVGAGLPARAPARATHVLRASSPASRLLRKWRCGRVR